MWKTAVRACVCQVLSDMHFRKMSTDGPRSCEIFTDSLNRPKIQNPTSYVHIHNHCTNCCDVKIKAGRMRTLEPDVQGGGLVEQDFLFL